MNANIDPKILKDERVRRLTAMNFRSALLTSAILVFAIAVSAIRVDAQGNDNTRTGDGALWFQYSGLWYGTPGNGNTADGRSALTNNIGSYNTATGAYALMNNTGSNANTANGVSALKSLTNYPNNTNNDNNTAVGFTAFGNKTSGTQNTAIGAAAGQGDITGSFNTFVGSGARPNASSLTNATAIGWNAVVSASDALVLGSTAIKVGIGTSTPFDKLDVAGDVRVGVAGAGCIKNRNGNVIAGTCSSDERLKRNIEPFEPMLDKIGQIRPVYFDWRSDEYPERNFGDSRNFGLIAQDVEKVLPGMVTEDDRGYKAVNYTQLPLVLLQGLRELKAENDNLRQELQKQTEELRQQMETMRARFSSVSHD